MRLLIVALLLAISYAQTVTSITAESQVAAGGASGGSQRPPERQRCTKTCQNGGHLVPMECRCTCGETVNFYGDQCEIEKTDAGAACDFGADFKCKGDNQCRLQMTMMGYCDNSNGKTFTCGPKNNAMLFQATCRRGDLGRQSFGKCSNPNEPPCKAVGSTETAMAEEIKVQSTDSDRISSQVIIFLAISCMSVFFGIKFYSIKSAGDNVEEFYYDLLEKSEA